MTKTNYIGRQSGMTYVGLLILLMFIALCSVILIKVLPLYLENFKVKTALDSLAEESSVAALSPAEIQNRLLKRLDIDDVERVTRKEIKVFREGGKIVVTANYEARENLFANLDIVARFADNRVELGGP